MTTLKKKIEEQAALIKSLQKEVDDLTACLPGGRNGAFELVSWLTRIEQRVVFLENDYENRNSPWSNP